jgi:hypothetical protein
MTQINCSSADKQEFDSLKPDEMTQKEFIGELLAAYRRDNGEIVDVAALVDRIEKQVASEIELAAYRGVTEGLE